MAYPLDAVTRGNKTGEWSSIIRKTPKNRNVSSGRKTKIKHVYINN